METPTETAEKTEKTEKESASELAEKKAEHISFDTFMKVEMRVAQILEAERVEESEKLVKLKIDLEEADGPRQLVAGIAKHYTVEELIGRKIVVVANLKPRKLMGLVSQGMLLAASDDSGNLELLSPGNAIKPGSRIS